MSKPHAQSAAVNELNPSLFSVRFLLCLALIIAGIAYITWYYLGARDGSPKAVADLGNWNYAIGFGAILLGLVLSAHPDTPLGRGNGVVVGMLGSFIIGLLWICTFYVISNDPYNVPIFNDLLNYNLLVGIGFMAAGFAFATRWE